MLNISSSDPTPNRRCSPKALRAGRRIVQTIVQIEEPASNAASPPRLQDFLSLGFRPLYFAGVAWSIVGVALWIFVPQWLQPPLAGVAWHAHEMLWGFVATIAVGFALTAGATWTGINPLRGGPLAVVCALWALARIGFVVGGSTWFLVAAVADVAFFACAAIAMARVVAASRNRRNYGVPLLLLGLAAADALFLLAAWRGEHALLMQQFKAGMLVMALIALLIARRVIPFFAMRAVVGLQVPLHLRSGQAQLAACAVALVALLAGWPALQAIGLGAAGLLALVQVVARRPSAVRHKPLLWILYLGFAGLGFGLLAAAAQAAGLALRDAVPVHVIAMAGFSVLIIGMVTRTALGHLGRTLALDRSMLASYGLVLAAVVLRLFALWPSPFSVLALQASALAWIAGLGLYLWRFAPWMVRPRADAAVAPIAARRP
jgi:uncharacterized protein involved in response to NO